MRRTASSNGPKPEQAFSCAAREESVSAKGDPQRKEAILTPAEIVFFVIFILLGWFLATA